MAVTRLKVVYSAAPSKPLKVGIIGCGDVHVVHAAAILESDDAELVAIAETEKHRREFAALEHGVPGYADYREMFEKHDLDVVHICTPHDQHVRPAIYALKRGVHVLLEKPVAAHLDEARRLEDAVRRAAAKGIQFAVCFQNRYNVSYQKTKELIDSGELGHISGSVAVVPWKRTPEYYRTRPWRGSWKHSGGGVLINQAIHTIDALAWFFGGIDSVNGIASQTEFSDLIEVEDTAYARFTHPSGSVSQFFATNTSPVQSNVAIRVFSDKATLQIYDGLKVEWRDGHVNHYDERTLPGVGRDYWGISHIILINDFYEHIKSGDTTPFWIGIEQGMVALKALKEIQGQSPQWSTLVAKEN